MSQKPTTTSYNSTKTNNAVNASNESSSSGDPYCNGCNTSAKYTYRKYRNPRPMKHYRYSYNDAVNGVSYKTGRGVNTVASMERPGGLVVHTTTDVTSSDTADPHCVGCGKKAYTEWMPNNNCCDSNVHITRSANTSIPRVKSQRVMSNRERLRQRGLTYKQNIFNNTVNASDAPVNSGLNNNSENCCTTSTVQLSNNKYYTQGAVDSGTRMANLKFNTFNTANQNTKHKFRGDYKNRNENEQHNVIERARNYNWGRRSCCPVGPERRPDITSSDTSE